MMISETSIVICLCAKTKIHRILYWKNPSMFKYITLMEEISSKKKLPRLVSVFCKGIIINAK